MSEIIDQILNKWVSIHESEGRAPEVMYITPAQCRELGIYLMKRDSYEHLVRDFQGARQPYYSMVANRRLPKDGEKYYFMGSELKVIDAE